MLREQGFEVIYHDNLGVSAFRRAIRDFTQRAQTEEGVALFYYAGHAVSMDGRNYLLPTDIRATDPDAISDDSVDVDNAILAVSTRAGSNSRSSYSTRAGTIPSSRRTRAA